MRTGKHIRPAAVLGVALLLSAATISCDAARPATGAGEARGERLIVVVGEGSSRSAPDTAYLEVGVQTQAPTAAQAQQANAASVKKVLEALAQAGVKKENLKTSSVYLNPVFDYDSPGRQGPPKIVAFQAANHLTITVERIETIGSLIDTCVGAGANSIHGLSFVVKDEAKLRQLKSEALKKAVEDARPKGEAIAAALGVTIKSINSVEEGAAELYPFKMALRGAEGAGLETPILPGEVTVSATVRVEFSY